MTKYISAAIGTLGCMLSVSGTAAAAANNAFNMARSLSVVNAGCALQAKAHSVRWLRTLV